MNNTSYVDLIATAITAINTLQRMSADERVKFLRDNSPIPPNVSLGDGNHILTTKDGLQAIYDIGIKWRAENSDRKEKITLKRMSQISDEVFGDALANDELSNKNYEAISKILKDRFDKRLSAIQNIVVHSFPCLATYSQTLASANLISVASNFCLASIGLFT